MNGSTNTNGKALADLRASLNSVRNDNVITAKGQHPADGSDRWSVTGEAGKVVYDVLGNHLALIPTLGEIDSVMGRTLARVGEYAQMDDDDAVFLLLENLYYSELAVGVTR